MGIRELWYNVCPTGLVQFPLRCVYSPVIRNSSQIKMAKNGNPQGKGLVPALEQWRSTQPALVRARSPREVLGDYFTTLLVLSAEFSFKPSVDVDYYLYRRAGGWVLSLIAPAEWGERLPGPCLGRCELLPDMTWQLEPAEDLADYPEMRDALEAFHEGFLTLLDREGSLEDNLPFYVRDLPYYRRLLAAGLSNSLKQSLALSGLDERHSREWLTGTPLPRLS